eukprot:9356383-Ditylum_brightwellii.AAC.1
MGGRVNITLDPKSTDPLVHSCMPFNDVMDVVRQQKFIMCTAEGRIKATPVYCGLYTAVADREVDHLPTCHA